MENPIYSVMVEGKQTPARTYDDYDIAEAEAKRLAVMEHRTVYVLQVITKVELNDVKITRL